MVQDRYWIQSVIRNKKGVITHCKIGDQLYNVQDLHKWYKELDFRFYTSQPERGTTEQEVYLVKTGKSVYFATEPDSKIENNLDYLPISRLD